MQGENMKTYIDVINDYMKENRLTRKQFCKLCNLSENTFKSMMKKRLNLHLATIIKIATGTKMRIDHIICIDEDDYASSN